MVAFKVLLLVTLFVSYCNGENPPCTPKVKNEPFTDSMEKMNCAVDKNLLRLFATEEVFNNSIVDNPYSNFMCIGLMNALTLVPETLCDVYNPLGDIQDGDFCSSSKIATLRKISNSSMFDEKSNFVTVSKYTEGNCKQICKDSTNYLCWSFGIIAEAVWKYTQSTDVPPTAAPQPSTAPKLPYLSSQYNGSPGSVSSDKPEDNRTASDGGGANTNDIGGDKGQEKAPDKPEGNNHTDGDVNNDSDKGGDETHSDKPEDNNHTDGDVNNDGDKGDETHSDKPEDTLTDYFNKNKDNNSESINNPSTKDGDGKEISNEDNEENKESEDHNNEGPIKIVSPGNDDIDDDRSHPLGGSDSNQTVKNSTKDQSQPNGTEIGNDTTDTHAEDGTEDNDDAQDGTGQDLNSSQDIADGDDDSTDENPDQERVNFDGNDDDDDGYSYWHFAAILLFILFLGVAGYLASLNRKKVSTYNSGIVCV